MLTEKINLHSAYGALMIMDSHFGRPITTAILTIEGQTPHYRIKADGYYVFTRPLPEGAMCCVNAPGYGPRLVPVDYDAQGRFFALTTLSQLPGQPQLNYVRKLLGRLSHQGQPLPETSFSLSLCGRISSLILIEQAEAGAKALRLNTEGENRLLGQELLLPQAYQDRLQICGLEGEDSYVLARPLEQGLEQGCQLRPCWELSTDHKGEFLFPYKPHLLREAQVEISLSWGDSSQSCLGEFPSGADGLLAVDFS